MDIKKIIDSYVDSKLDEYKDIALQIHANPEVSNYEFFSSKILADKLSENGFKVDYDVAGHRTGFAAYYKSNKPGPVIVFLAEYDALAGLGHGCGHNIFGSGSVLAGVALKEVIDEIGGEVRVYGTPGEEGGENGSAKGSFVREGFFKDVDAAICCHPGTDDYNYPTSKTLGCAPVDIEFWGKSSHAASAPEKGINALDALIMVYNAINALRQQLPSDVKIHGIITNGGKAPNAIPDYASAKFYIRANSMPGLNDVYAKVERIVEGAALQTGAKGRMQNYQNIVENTVLTPSFDSLFEENLKLFGSQFSDNEIDLGSSDVGNVSQIVPTIQPMMGICENKIINHSIEMVAASCSEKGLNSIALNAKVMAATAVDLILKPEVLAKIKEEHAFNVAHQ